MLQRELVKACDGTRGYMVSDDQRIIWFAVSCACGWEMTGDWCPEYCPECSAELTDHIPAGTKHRVK